MKNTITMKENIPTLIINDPLLLSEYIMIDVRTEDEFNAELGHIDGAKKVTLGEELDLFLKNLDKNKKILFICRSGARSGKATLQAMELGFNDVFNMDGGMLNWNEKKFPIKRES
jgi:rhodanese-related sulfurtransferase